jgi:hypothetical protein
MYSALAPLLGLTLWDAGRAADLEWFAFGPRRIVHDSRGEPKEVGEYALHVQCAWRITQGGKVLVASRDLYYPAGSRDCYVPPGFNWDVQGANRRDELTHALFQDGKHEFNVQEIAVYNAGAFRLDLSSELALQVFPDDSSLEEHWRVFRPYRDDEHWVFRGEGFGSL